MSIYRFDDFRFDSTRAQLTRNDEDLKLRPQTARFLAFMLTNRDRLVPKEELIAEIWGDSFVNDQAVFQCVNQLRKALGESAGDPKFLRTVPRRGYRWIADAVLEEEPQPNIGAAKPESKPDAPAPPSSGGITVTGQLRVVRKQRFRWMTVSLVLAFSLAVVLMVILLPRFWGQPHIKGRLALLPFANETGDSQLHWIELGLMDMMLRGFSDNEVLSPISTERVLKALKDSGLQRGQRADEEKLKQVRRLLGADHAVSITVRGRREAFELVCLIVDQEENIDSHIFTGANLTDLALRVSGELKGELTGDRKPVAHAFSKDPFVNQSYAHGLQAYYDGFIEKAVPYFEVCIQKDPDFLPAAYQLAGCQYDLGQDEKARRLAEETLTKATETKNALIPDLLSFMGDLSETGEDITEALAYYQQAHDLWQQAGDREGEWVALMNLAGLYAYDQATEEDALNTFKKALALSLESGDEHGQAQVYGSMGLFEMMRDNVSEGLALLEQELGIWQKLDHKDAQAIVHMDLGRHYLFHGRRDKGRAHLNEAAELAAQTDSLPIQVTALTTLGEMAIEEEAWDTAHTQLDRAAALVQNLGNPGEELEVRLMQTKLASLQPHPALMSRCGERAVALARQLADTDSELFVWSAYSDFEYNQGDRKAGLSYLEKVAAMAGEDHPITLLLRARDAYEHGRYQTALDLQQDVKKHYLDLWDQREESLLIRYREAAAAGEQSETPIKDPN